MGEGLNEDFRYIAAIAEHGSISKAARAVHLSQPGLSQRLRRLEQRMGAELFDRTRSPLAPTPSGEVFLKYARRALEAETTMWREVRNVANRKPKRLRIGVSMPRANALLCEPVMAFYELHRSCTVELREMSTLDHLHRLFVGDEIDCALLTPITPDPSMYASEVLCKERLLIVSSDSLKLPQIEHAAATGVSLRRLEGVPFVLPLCGSYFDPLISHLIDESNVQLDIVVRDCSAELALELVSDGLGVSLVPLSWVAGRSHLRSMELADVRAGNVLRYVRRLDRPPSEEQLVFLELVRNFLDKEMTGRSVGM